MSPSGTLERIGRRGGAVDAEAAFEGRATRPRPGPPPRPSPARPPTRPSGPRRPTAARQRYTFGRRVRFLRFALVGVLLLMVGRLVDVQVLRSGSYAAQGAQELAVRVTVPALRGGIYDRQGKVLALSVPTKEVLADDFQVQHPATEAAELAPLLHLPVARLTALLSERSGYVVLARNLAETAGQTVAGDNFPGITLVDSAVRALPDGGLASPVLGLVNAAGQGAAGLEYQYNRQLAGVAGGETLLESPIGVALPGTPITGRVAARPGTGLELSLDEDLQYQTEQALAAEVVASDAVSGIAEIMDVRTGQILAMANLVNNDPNKPGAAAAAAASAGLPHGNAPVAIGPDGPVSEASSDLALTQLYEPGSDFKLVTFSAALQDGVITPNTVFTVPDQILLDGSIFHDAETHPTEPMTATQIIAQSSNIGTSEIAESLGETRLLQQVRQLGFGEPTGLGFPGASPGLLAGPSQWEPTDYVSLPIGQVDAVSAQQVLDAYNAVANGGVFVHPKLVDASVTANGKVTPTPPSASKRVMSPAVAGELVPMLEQVVKVGTGTLAVIPGYTVAGKTGTSNIPIPGKDAYSKGAYMGTFVGFAPAQHPVFSAIVILDRPTPIYGGSVAAPVFAKIMGDALHRYDIPSTPGAPTDVQPHTSLAAQAQDVTG